MDGSLHARGSRGVGLTVRISMKSDVQRAVTFWQQDYDASWSPNGADDCVDTFAYFTLAQYAAVWIWFKYAELIQVEQSILGTQDWQAYAQFLAGVNIENSQIDESTRKTKAREHYVNALRLDPEGFYAAKYNLSNLAGTEDKDLTLNFLNEVNNKASKADPTKYYAGYKLGVRLHALRQSGTHFEFEETSEKVLRRVNGQIKERVSHLDPNLKCTDKSPDVIAQLHFLRNFLSPLVESGLIAVQLLRKWDESLIKDLDNLTSQAVTPRHFYNMACTYSLAMCHSPDELRSELAENSLKMMRITLLLDPKYKDDFAKDHDLDFVRGFLTHTQTSEQLFSRARQLGLLGEGRFEIYRDPKRKFRFRLRNGDERILLKSQSYSTKGNVCKAIESVRNNAKLEKNFQVKKSRSKKRYFCLIAKNHQIIAVSAAFYDDSEELSGAMQETIQLVPAATQVYLG